MKVFATITTFLFATLASTATAFAPTNHWIRSRSESKRNSIEAGKGDCSKAEEERIEQGEKEDPVATADSMKQEREGIYVDDTYLLGKQLASTLNTAEIDVMGLDDEEAIAPALADALLDKIKRDSYEQNNEGWNQSGAETLYSIGGAHGNSRLEDGFLADDDAFTDELLQQISARIATASSEDDLDSTRCDGEEMSLVADSIINIINRDEHDNDSDEIPIDTALVDTINVQAEAIDGDDDKPPSSYRFVLEVNDGRG